MKNFIKIILFLFSVTLIIGCTRNSPRIDAYNFYVKTYYCVARGYIVPPGDSYSLDYFLNLYATGQMYFMKSYLSREYGDYIESGDTIVTYPKYIEDDFYGRVLIANDTLSYDRAVFPTIFIKQKDGSLIKYMRVRKDDYREVKSIKYNGVEYELGDFTLSRWDYRQCPEEVRDSIRKMMEYYNYDNFFRYIPLKYAEY